jgi:NAD(P)-dependent dehydrogenase (short-subunit alcohol dehydrogenase family)
MHGKTVLITGGSSGIGLETARGLARRGAKVIIVGRNPQKTADAVRDLRESTGSTEISSLLADLSLMSETRRLAADFNAGYDRLDVLINNAGGVFQKRTYTAEDLEYTFALNHMSYYLLTRLLLDKLIASGPSRVVNVSSGAHFMSRGVNFEDLQRRQGRFIGFGRYNETKLMNVMFTLALARRLDPASVTVNAVHPGLVASGFGHNNGGLLSLGTAIAARLFGKNTVQGAETTIYVAATEHGGAVTGLYFEDSKSKPPSKQAQDVEAQERLWSMSATLAGLPA